MDNIIIVAGSMAEFNLQDTSRQRIPTGQEDGREFFRQGACGKTKVRHGLIFRQQGN